MIISKRRKFIFAAFNKTGTTSIEGVLKRYNNLWLQYLLRRKYEREVKGTTIFKHIRPLDLKAILGEERWNQYFTFTFVRNPWSRAVSLYLFHRNDPNREKWKLAHQSFEEWVHGGGTGTAKRSMTEFISDDDGNVIVDFVGKFENLNRDFRIACDQVGLPAFELPHLNQSTQGDYRQHYTNETRDIVADWCRVDIETFGYDF